MAREAPAVRHEAAPCGTRCRAASARLELDRAYGRDQQALPGHAFDTDQRHDAQGHAGEEIGYERRRAAGPALAALHARKLSRRVRVRTETGRMPARARAVAHPALRHKSDLRCARCKAARTRDDMERARPRTAG